MEKNDQVGFDGEHDLGLCQERDQEAD